MSVGERAGFWDWSLSRYAADGAAPLLLRLQDDYRLNVNVLLWCGWCARYYEEIPAATMGAAVALTGRWSSEIAAPLRAVRRSLKSPPAIADAKSASILRSDVKAVELAAEKIEQEMLERFATESLSPLDDPAGTEIRLRRNFSTCARASGPPPNGEDFDALLDELAIIIMAGA